MFKLIVVYSLFLQKSKSQYLVIKCINPSVMQSYCPTVRLHGSQAQYDIGTNQEMSPIRLDA